MGKERIKVKQGVNFEDFNEVNASLIIVLGYFLNFCEKNGLECTVTSVKEHVEGRTSSTHEQGRAFDASVEGFSDSDILRCIGYMNKHVGKFGAYSSSDYKQRVIIHHEVFDKYGVSMGPHFHLQVHR